MNTPRLDALIASVGCADLRMSDAGITKEELKNYPKRVHEVLGGDITADPLPLSDADVLPRGFKKIRYFGFLWPSARAKNLAIFKKLQGRQVYEPRFTRNTDKGQISKILFGHTGPRCPHCGEYKLEYRVTTNSSGKIVFPLQAASNAENYGFENLNDRQRSKVIQYKKISEDHGYYHQMSLFPQSIQSQSDPNDPENRRQELDQMRRTYLTPEALGAYR